MGDILSLERKDNSDSGKIKPWTPSSHPGQALLKEMPEGAENCLLAPVPLAGNTCTAFLWGFVFCFFLGGGGFLFFGFFFFLCVFFPLEEEWCCRGAWSCAKPHGADHREPCRCCQSSHLPPTEPVPVPGRHVVLSHGMIPTTPCYGHCSYSDYDVRILVPHVQHQLA